MSKKCLECGVLLAAAIIPRSALAGSDVIQLDEQTAQRLIAVPELGWTDPEEKDYAWGDVDQDGDIDLVVVRKHPTEFPGGRRNVLFINEGQKEGHALNGVLVDRTLQFAVDSDVGGDQGFLADTPDRDVQLADLDGDGWLDIVTAALAPDGLPKHISHPRIYINKGDDAEGNWLGFRYEDARIPQLSPVDANGYPYGPRFNAVGVGDVTGDGAPDLFFADGDDIGPAEVYDVNNKLLINDGQGFFVDETVQRLQPQMYYTHVSNAAAIADMNGDGANDLLVHDDFVKFAYNNVQEPGYFEVLDHWLYAGYFTIDATVGNLNNDGKTDFVLTDIANHQFFINQGNGPDGLAIFWENSLPAYGGNGGETVIADLDADGFNDVIMTGAYYDPYSLECDDPFNTMDTQFLRNIPDPRYHHFENEQPIPDEIPTKTHDVAAFDLDGDGLNDVILGLCEGTSVWLNHTSKVEFSFPEGVPAFLPPGRPYALPVAVDVQGPDPLVDGTLVLHVSIDGNPLTPVSLPSAGGGLFIATLPALGCLAQASFYFEAALTDGSTFVDPPAAPVEPYVVYSAQDTILELDADLEGDVSGWQVINDPSLLNGAWELADASGYPGQDASPDGVMAFLTSNGYGVYVDGGPTMLLSPVFSAAGDAALISFQYYFSCDDAGTPQGDALTVSISNDAGATWTTVQTITADAWTWPVIRFIASSTIPPTATMRMRFSVADQPNNSYTSAGIDELRVDRLFCRSLLPGDLNGDGDVDLADHAGFGPCLTGPGGGVPMGCSAADLQADADVDLVDWAGFQRGFTGP